MSTAKRILLVEDEEAVRLTTSELLEMEDFEVVAAANGAEALALLEQHDIDIVLSDVRMPIVDGLELFRRLKVRRPDLPVVLMTAFTAEDAIDTAIADGVFAVISKPFDFDAALAIIDRALKRPMILVIDGNTSDAEALGETLRGAGLRAAAVGTTDEAFALIQAGAVDVCVANLQAPGIDGITLAQRIRQSNPSISVIVCTAPAFADTAREAANSPEIRVLPAPFDPQDLIHAIATARSQSPRT